ncbi:hypothetical protein HanXRQr2_Chr15g0681551 [Helianthus annuus]|uniref:Uncharacterized protein n=1 Tax=Helianthus annuus TaxID=4232 RepID=A0A9K3DYN1_HELAN|nr:hypothetical protein HanXRQr2_Chr15g0681551 [Helianthus annuus]
MVKPDLDLWTGTDPIFRIVNRFCILCLIGSRVRSGNDQVGSGFFLLLTPKSRSGNKFIILKPGTKPLFSPVTPFVCKPYLPSDYHFSVVTVIHGSTNADSQERCR